MPSVVAALPTGRHTPCDRSGHSVCREVCVRRCVCAGTGLCACECRWACGLWRV